MAATQILKSPDDTREWKHIRTPAGLEGYTDPHGVTYVTARADESPEVRVIFTRTPSLPDLLLVRTDNSLRERATAKRRRRAQRELTKRGYK